MDASCSETSSSHKTFPSPEDRATFVTGFGPFGEFDQNLTEVLACGCSWHQVLPVSFAAVDRFLAELDMPEGSTWVQLGVSSKAIKPTFELAARNRNGESPDVEGLEKPGEIEPGPPVLLGTLWSQAIFDSLQFDFEVSSDAGGYLCNYLYYRSLRRFNQAKIGFLHVPPETTVPLADLKALLDETLAAVNDQLTA